MHELDLAGNLERAGEDDAHVAHRDRHGVAVDDDETARGVDHEAGAAVVALGDARDRVRHVEAHADERRRERRGARIVGLGEARAAAGLGFGEPRLGNGAHCHRPAASSRRQWLAGNQRRSMRALRTLEPFGIVDRRVAHGEAFAIGEAGHHGFEGREVRRGLAVGAGDHRAARHAGRAEDVARDSRRRRRSPRR